MGWNRFWSRSVPIFYSPVFSLDNYEEFVKSKVHVFWEGHKIWHKSSNCNNIIYWHPKTWGILSHFLGLLGLSEPYISVWTIWTNKKFRETHVYKNQDATSGRILPNCEFWERLCVLCSYTRCLLDLVPLSLWCTMGSKLFFIWISNIHRFTIL